MSVLLYLSTLSKLQWFYTEAIVATCEVLPLNSQEAIDRNHVAKSVYTIS